MNKLTKEEGICLTRKILFEKDKRIEILDDGVEIFRNDKEEICRIDNFPSDGITIIIENGNVMNIDEVRNNLSVGDYSMFPIFFRKFFNSL
jgi:hypothetical protein